jgi:8-oxo-dGTP pyrophosphatase MutT (NUDIX family)
MPHPDRECASTGTNTPGDAAPGPRLRTDLIDVYLFHRAGPRVRDARLLQLRRDRDPMRGTWQPVMGHVERGETATGAAFREVAEETGLRPDAGIRQAWQLERVRPFFLAARDEIVLGAAFAMEVTPAGVDAIRLDAEHDALRWMSLDDADRAFLWPGQRGHIADLARDILDPGSAVADVLRVTAPG